MRYIRYCMIFLIGLSFILMTSTNRQFVTLKLLPDVLSSLVGVSLQIRLPLFLVILFGILLGLLMGFVWEWVREYKYCRTLSRKSKQLKTANKQVNRLKRQNDKNQDELLKLIK